MSAAISLGRRRGTASILGGKLLRDPLALVSLVILVLVLAAALVPDLIQTHSPTRITGNRLAEPGWANFFGTDQFGRDVFSRAVAGAQVSITVGVVTVLLAVVIGVPLGAIAGYASPGPLDAALMRLMDILLAFPPIILAIAVIAALGTEELMVGPIEVPHIAKLMFVIGLLYAPQVARVVRSAVLVEKAEQYVMADQALGIARSRTLFLGILRNCLSPILVQGTLLVANAIIAEASLSFLGLGIQPPQPSWGVMLSDSKTYVQSGEWWLTVFPGALIFLTVCALNILGDALRDALDPRDAGTFP
ncbi:ABC transporter permease [Falsiroseomonas sp. E2-1-a20]|uniref:ABC transporter permease n=1 Tax=Falsiroseomonas sp. E2-1-a20 TaxID=3239300 RepID=UPI003F347C69